MNYLQQLIEEVRIVLFITLLVNNILLFGLWYATREVWHLAFSVVVVALLFGGIIIIFILERIIAAVITQPLQLLWRNILRTTPNDFDKPNRHLLAKLTNMWLGKDLVSVLTGQVNQLANEASNSQLLSNTQVTDLHKNFIANSLPLPLIVLDDNERVVFANQMALRYLSIDETTLIGSNLRSKVTITFSQADQDLSAWLNGSRTAAVTATKTWEDVKIENNNSPNQKPLQFDMAAFYNKDNPEKWETMLIFFDHSEKYSTEDEDIDFIALAVHELRTPITMLRGYIEVLDELLSGKLQGETGSYFAKMKVASEQLATFTNNIFNVAHIEGNQMEIHMQEVDWSQLIRKFTAELSERASVHGMTLECAAAEALPTVGVDPVSIKQVVANLVDNAIKYSAGRGKTIVIAAQMRDGLVETTVKDTGVGIPESVIPTLFNRYQRNFHNKSTVTGTGLGLYLSKLIVNIHGGNIWISSKEGVGTTVGFTLLPYAKLSSGLKTEQGSIIRGSHGWIKNHHMSRR